MSRRESVILDIDVGDDLELDEVEIEEEELDDTEELSLEDDPPS
jgi:hypothetical protein